MAAAGAERARLTPAAPASGLRMTAVETWNARDQDVALFDPFTDTLNLVMFYDQGPGVIDLPGLVIVGVWQIIEVRTGQVVYHFSYQANDPLRAPSILWQHNVGTPHDAGLRWTEGADVFAFRAIVEAFRDTGPGGLRSLASFDVSSRRWFRLALAAEL
jgi:hypothetical protein